MFSVAMNKELFYTAFTI